MNSGGAVAVRGGILKVRNSALVSNDAINGEGGGVSCVQSQVVISNSSFERSLARLGGALNALSCGGSSIVKTAFLRSEAANGGGGLRLLEQSSFTLEDVVLQWNSVEAGSGGAVLLEQSSALTMRRVGVRHNSARSGGGLALLHGSSAVSASNADVRLRGSLAWRRWQQAAAAAAVTTEAGGATTGTTTAIEPPWRLVCVCDNLASDMNAREYAKESNGGGILLKGRGTVTGTIRNLLVTRNTAAGFGGGVHISGR